MQPRGTASALEAAVRASLTSALRTGADILDQGGSALDAVEKATILMEDDPLFNAGRGAVFTGRGEIELDASIMDGASLRAGAVAGVTHTRHPIALARAVMEKSPHVMLIGPGADAFARDHGLEQVDPSFFFTERQWQELARQLGMEGKPVPPRPPGAPPTTVEVHPDAKVQEFGTVGAVALDRNGNVAAATSTGGVRGKLPGRVGDSAIIGAGTYASNDSCAVSGTGTGELFMRLTIAHEVAALVQLGNRSLQGAVNEVIQNRLAALNGDGGIIAVAPDGQCGWSFNTPGMYRARVAEGGEPEVAIFPG